MVRLGSSNRTNAYEIVRAGRIYGQRGIHVNHLVYWPGPHGKQKVDLIEERMIAGVVENDQDNEGNRDGWADLLKRFIQYIMN